jgi:acyl carrier protein
MNRDDIDSRLADVAGTVLGVEPDLLSDTASPETVDGWTSLVHLSLIVAVEEAFSIHLSVADIYAAQSFGALRRIVSERVASGAR